MPTWSRYWVPCEKTLAIFHLILNYDYCFTFWSQYPRCPCCQDWWPERRCNTDSSAASYLRANWHKVRETYHLGVCRSDLSGAGRAVFSAPVASACVWASVTDRLFGSGSWMGWWLTSQSRHALECPRVQSCVLYIAWLLDAYRWRWRCEIKYFLKGLQWRPTTGFGYISLIILLIYRRYGAKHIFTKYIRWSIIMQYNSAIV